MNTLQKTMENWFTAVAYADAGQSGWTDDLWTLNGKRESTALKQTLLYGAGSIVIYVLAFANADAFAALCAKGGLWTALPIASVLLSLELFGGTDGVLYFAFACAVSYLLSGYCGLYSSQTILYSKLRAEFINVHAKE